jgi:predicted DNA-binding ArsR family transcriptional regulator
MTFEKQFTKDDFLKVLSHDWQKTREIADKVSCKNRHATNTLLQMEEVEFRWTKGGKSGTREWKLKGSG